MNKSLKIIVNILVFILIVGFGYYMIHSIVSEKKTTQQSEESTEDTFVSPYKKMYSFDVASDILCFDIHENIIYVALNNQISIFDLLGKHLYNSEIEANVRDIAIDSVMIFLLYPTKIVSYTLKGEKICEMNACSDNSDYCSFTTTKDYIFVTDAENKHIVQYDKQGKLVRFIRSPEGFVIPSYSFDIMNINDTIYCSNSGRHKVESYTIDGEFIASFGTAGTQIGAFAGCCNPVYLAKTASGNILTSEKGNPRISYYGKDGKFRTLLFDNNTLGGGTDAYKVRFFEEYIYIAQEKTISVYAIEITCPPNVKSCGECPMRDGCKK
jgi:hypothetical protein